MRRGDPAAASQAAADNAASLRAALARANGWTVLRDRAVTAVTSARPRQNRAIVTDPTTSQREVAAALDEFYGVDVPWFLVEDEWGRDWRAVGFELYATMSIMVCDTASRVAPSSDLDIAVVATAPQLREFERTLVDAFPLPDPRLRRPGALWTPAVLDIHGLTLLLGCRAGAPVATGCSWAHRGVVGVYWIAVRPQQRGRGYGRAMITAALTPGAPGVLIATSAGEPVYMRVGFHAAATATWWTAS